MMTRRTMARRGLVGGPLRQRRHRRRREVSNPRPGRHRRAGPSGSSAAPVVVRRRPRSRRAFFLTQASGEETWQIFQQIGTLNRLSKNRPYNFFLLKNLLQGREGGKLLQFASFVFHQQIFQQIFASHEPSFGPYKFAQKFATSSPSPNFSTKSAPSVSREAHVRRSGDSARECRVAVLLATSGAGRAITICREKRRARRQWRELTHADLVDF